MRGLDEAGANGVAADATVAEFNRNRPGKHVAGPFGRIIQHLIRRRVDRRDRGGADNRPLARRQHERQHGAGDQIHAFHIHIEQEVPVLFGGLQKGFDDDGSGMVEQHIDRPQPVGNRRYRPVNIHRAADIGGGKDCRETRRHQFFRQGFTPDSIAVDDPNRRPFGREQPRGGGPTATGTAGNHRNFSCQTHGHPPLSLA